MTYILRELFRFCSEQITDPLALPLHPFAEWVVLTVLHKFAYKLAFSKVGDYYRTGAIRGGLVGSLLHWFFRTIIFIAFWAGINVVITMYMFITEHWRMILVTTGGAVLLVAVAMVTCKIVMQRRCMKVNNTTEST